MSKDGTMRGGKRQKSGPEPDPLAEKVAKGAKNVETVSFPIPSSIVPVDVPKPEAFLSKKQADGDTKFKARKIYDDTMRWIIARGCGELINPHLVQSYADAYARFMQCSEAVSEYGFISKHPTTGAPIASPFTQLEQQYQKQAFVLWNDIWETIKQNCMKPYDGLMAIDPMEALLSAQEK